MVYKKIRPIVVWKQHILLQVLTNTMKKDENELDITYLNSELAVIFGQEIISGRMVWAENVY